ncbi:LamG-like jellyroll fold domain-containing protein [Aquipuribacter sp. SD81]|uniref:LamG-like jellyroll fold domain-containing protein n=1 Tax=Aquipuribacter sp. SD81 TaxID=3127703 RepID=UPI003016D56B
MLACSGLVAATTAAAQAAEVAAPTDGLLAEYVFDATSGTTVANDAGGPVGGARVVNGTDDRWTGTSLRFTGGAKTGTGTWVELPDDMLTTATSATVTIETRIDASMRNSWNFLWNVGSESTSQYWFASVRDNPRTAVTTSGSGGEVNARSGSPLSADRWYSLTSVIDGDADRITFYVDGEQVASAPTTLTPASITNQTLNTIGRAPYPDPLFRGEVATFRVYDRALDVDEVREVSDTDAAIHADTFQTAARAALDRVVDVTLDDTVTNLPDYGGTVSWSSTDTSLEVSADGTSVTTDLPTAGGEPRSGTLTATASVRGVSASREVTVTAEPAAEPDDDYGYLMVHFIEDPAGYAEKIYLDVSRGDNPEQWDPLNGGEPILASDLGTTGVRDPYLTYNPETGTYYVIATDLRVFGGNQGSGSCTSWCWWSSQGSTKLNVWESQDLVTWSDLRQFDVAVDDGIEQAELGMAWAPEATWVDDYYADGRGAFVLYWSSNLYDDAQHTGSTYSRVMWGATPDFTQETYDFGGVFIDEGGNTIDTTITQHEGTTYRVTKDNTFGTGLYYESTTAERWWEPAAEWTQIQDRIGAEYANDNPGGVEGPAIFKAHDEERWYLYVDVIPIVGYRPLTTTDLDAGWELLSSPDFSMAPSTKHGGIVGLTREQYDEVREADATGAVTEDLGSVGVPADADAAAVRAALPATAEVTLAYGRGTAEQPVEWDVASVDASTPGSYEVSGTVRTIGANLNAWVGANGSTAYGAPDRELYSTTAIPVSARVVVGAAEGVDVTATASTRCVAGRVALVVRATNEHDAPVRAVVETPYGTRDLGTLEPGRGSSVALSTRQASVPAGSAQVTATAGGAEGSATADYAPATC